MAKEKLTTKIQIPKSNHGITLVALIITIVVMLILVAVTLAIALGENGIVNNAKDSRKKYEIAEVKEFIEMAKGSSYDPAIIDLSQLSKKYYEEENVEYANILQEDQLNRTLNATLNMGEVERILKENDKFSVYTYVDIDDEELLASYVEMLYESYGDISYKGAYNYLTSLDNSNKAKLVKVLLSPFLNNYIVVVVYDDMKFEIDSTGKIIESEYVPIEEPTDELTIRQACTKFSWEELTDDTCAIIKYIGGDADTVTIPSKIGNYTVTQIGGQDADNDYEWIKVFNGDAEGLLSLNELASAMSIDLNTDAGWESFYQLLLNPDPGNPDFKLIEECPEGTTDIKQYVISSIYAFEVTNPFGATDGRIEYFASSVYDEYDRLNFTNHVPAINTLVIPSTVTSICQYALRYSKIQNIENNSNVTITEGIVEDNPYLASSADS